MSKVLDLFLWKIKNYILSSSLVAAGIAVISLCGIFLFITVESMEFILDFSWFSGSNWNPMEGEFNLLPMILSSFCIMLFSSILSVTASVLISLSVITIIPKPYWSHWQSIIQLLSSIPSVVYGFWGVSVVVPLLVHFLGGSGQIFLSGILVLSLMLIPICTSLYTKYLILQFEKYQQLIQVLQLSKMSFYIEVVFANHWKNIRQISLISSTRAIGETIAVLMVVGNVVNLPNSFLSPVRILTSNIALEMPYAENLHRSSLFASAFFIIVIISLLISIFKYWGVDDAY